MSERKIVGYRVEGELAFRNRFRSRIGAQRYRDAVEARLKEANKVCDGEIWTSIEIIYQTRWDCPTARLAAAFLYRTQFEGRA